MTNDFVQNALSNGPEGQVWLDSIPSIISRYAEKWSLLVLPPFHLSYNYVALAVRTDDTKVVLKIGFPKDEEFQTELQALQIFNGEGASKLLESDPENSVMLLERITPGTPLSEISDDDEATKILCRVMKKLWKPLPDHHKFLTVTKRSSAIARYEQKFKGVSGPIPDHLVGLAETLFAELIVTSTELVLVHGDLHHDNVLASGDDNWLAIDPKGVAAEPAFEVAAMIRNPYEKLKDIADLEPLLRNRLRILSSDLGIDSRRLLKWSVAQTMLSAIWNIESSAGPEHAIRVAGVLVKMLKDG